MQLEDVFVDGGVYFGVKMTYRDFLSKMGVSTTITGDFSCELAEKCKLVRDDLKSFGSNYELDDMGVDAQYSEELTGDFNELDGCAIFIGVNICSYSQKNEMNTIGAFFDIPEASVLKDIEQKLSRLFPDKPRFYTWSHVMD